MRGLPDLFENVATKGGLYLLLCIVSVWAKGDKFKCKWVCTRFDKYAGPQHKCQYTKSRACDGGL